MRLLFHNTISNDLFTFNLSSLCSNLTTYFLHPTAYYSLDHLDFACTVQQGLGVPFLSPSPMNPFLSLRLSCSSSVFTWHSVHTSLEHMDHAITSFFFLSLYWIFYNIVPVFWPWGMWNLSSLIRGQICMPCIGRQTLNHWTASAVPIASFNLCSTPAPLKSPWAPWQQG